MITSRVCARLFAILAISLAAARAHADTYETKDHRLQIELSPRFRVEEPPDASKIAGKKVNFVTVFSANEPKSGLMLYCNATLKADTDTKSLREFVDHTLAVMRQDGNEASEASETKLADVGLHAFRAISHHKMRDRSITFVSIFIEVDEAFEEFDCLFASTEENRLLPDAMALVSTIRRPKSAATSQPSDELPMRDFTNTTWKTPDGLIKIALGPGWRSAANASNRKGLQLYNDGLELGLTMNSIDLRDETSSVADRIKQMRSHAAASGAKITDASDVAIGKFHGQGYDVCQRAGGRDMMYVVVIFDTPKTRVFVSFGGLEASLKQSRADAIKLLETVDDAR